MYIPFGIEYYNIDIELSTSFFTRIFPRICYDELMQIRNTKQKQIVAQVVQESHAPLTVQEILVRAQKHLPTMGIATVYREVGRMSDSGALRTVTIPGDPPRYELPKHHHHHFKCTSCDNVFELEGCLKDIAKLVPKGFKHKMHDITLYGLCRDCA
jgi:Fur family ferric uptake transcriptional regulator